MKIERGPFANTEIPNHELVKLQDRDQFGSPIPNREVDWWPPGPRTAVFLEKFNPRDGYSVIVESTPGAFNLPDYKNRDQNTNEVPVQPTQQFVAKLVKDGVVLAQRSTLEVIDGPKAWERGETNAVGRLYEALGLPGSTKPFLHQLLGDTERPTATGSAIVIPITSGAAKAATSATPIAEASTPSEVPTPSASTPDAAPVESATPKSAEPSAENSTPPRVTHAPGIDTNLIHQIEVQAKLRGVTVPAFANKKEATTFYRDLLKAAS